MTYRGEKSQGVRTRVSQQNSFHCHSLVAGNQIRSTSRSTKATKQSLAGWWLENINSESNNIVHWGASEVSQALQETDLQPSNLLRRVQNSCFKLRLCISPNTNVVHVVDSKVSFCSAVLFVLTSILRPVKDNLETHGRRATNSTWHDRFRNADVHILRYFKAWPKILYQSALRWMPWLNS